MIQTDSILRRHRTRHEQAFIPLLFCSFFFSHFIYEIRRTDIYRITVCQL